MSKHLTEQETTAELRAARLETLEVHALDGPRNAAVFATIEAALQRFQREPHAPETTRGAVLDALERAGNAQRVADAYRITAADPLTALELPTHNDPHRVTAALGAVAQYAAAARQHADALADLETVLHLHLHGVLADHPTAL